MPVHNGLWLLMRLPDWILISPGVSLTVAKKELGIILGYDETSHKTCKTVQTFS